MNNKKYKNNFRNVVYGIAFTSGFIPPESSYALKYDETDFFNSIDSITKELSDIPNHQLKKLNNILSIFSRGHDNFVKEYVGGKNPIILNHDIYSLGKSFLEIVKKMKVNNKKINRVIQGMTNLNYTYRLKPSSCIKMLK